MPSEGSTGGKPYIASLEGTGAIVTSVAWTVAYPDAVAAMVVVPGVKVDLNLAVANVAPLLMVIVDSTVPTLVSDEDKLMIVSCSALAGLLVESCSCTNMHP